MICSGAIVFFDSASQISLASEDIRWMNSGREAQSRVTDQREQSALPTQHSIIKSRVSFAHVMSLGSSSTRVGAVVRPLMRPPGPEETNTTRERRTHLRSFS